MNKCICSQFNNPANTVPEECLENNGFGESSEQLKSAAEQLYESEQKYKLLIDNMTDIVWITDINGNIAFINNEIENILDYKKENVLGKPLYNLMCPVHQYKNCSDILTEMKNRDFHREELWMLHSDKTTRRVFETNTRRIYSSGVLTGIQGVARDATERIQLEEKLKRKNKQLSALNEISSSIASVKISQSTNILFKYISKEIIDTINVFYCSIWLMGDDSKLHCMSADGILANEFNSDPIYVNTSDFNAAIANSDISKFTQKCRQYLKDYSKKNLDSSKIDKMLFIPLLLDNKPIGNLIIHCEDAFDEDYIDMLGSIANNIAFAIEKTDLYKEIKHSFLKTIKALIAAIEAKDPYTQGHSVRVSKYAVKISRELDMTAKEIDEIEIAGILHDIGKIGISDKILTKPGLLKPNEFEMVKEHPAIGCRILQPIGLSENIINATLLHHKRFDLKGYPENAPAKELPFIANIICVADAYDAMTSHRSYKPSMTKEEALEELRRHSGTQFCPDIVKVMERLYAKNLL